MRVGPSGSAFRSRPQTASKLLQSRAVVVSVGGKAREQLVQVSIRETNESEPFEDASLNITNVVKTRSVWSSWDKSARCLMTVRTATGVEGA